MKSFKRAFIFVCLGSIFFFIENMYFGWNRTPETYLEHVANFIVGVMFYAALFCYLRPALSLYHKSVTKKREYLLVLVFKSKKNGKKKRDNHMIYFDHRPTPDEIKSIVRTQIKMSDEGSCRLKYINIL